MKKRIYIKTLKRIFAISAFFLFGCSTKSQIQSESNELQFSREIAAFRDSDKDGSEITTRVIEQLDGDNRILRVKITANGETVESIHNLSGPSFYIEIPVLNRFRGNPEKEAPAAVTTEDFNANKDAVNQNIKKAREAMLQADYTNAMLAVSQALEIDPKNVEALMMKGSVFYALGETDKSTREYNKALEVDPDNTEVIEFLRYIEEKEKVDEPVVDPFQ